MASEAAKAKRRQLAMERLKRVQQIAEDTRGITLQAQSRKGSAGDPELQHILDLEDIAVMMEKLLGVEPMEAPKQNEEIQVDTSLVDITANTITSVGNPDGTDATKGKQNEAPVDEDGVDEETVDTLMKQRQEAADARIETLTETENPKPATKGKKK